jgi:lysophospholipase L1-like esterase
MRRTVTGVLVATLVLWLGGCCGKCHKCSSEPVSKYQVQMGSEPTTTPVPRNDAWWQKRHQAVLDRVKQGNVGMIWIGDSITHGWETGGKDVWHREWSKYNPVNMGFSGDRTQHVLWRLENGEISGINPKVAVIMIGTNNCGVNSPKEIADGIVAICQTLRKDLPHTKILLLGIFPRDPNTNSRARKINAEASQIASTIADNKHIYYMNINDKFLDKDGNLSKDIMPDYLHPNEKGYGIWAEAIEHKVAKLMK